jgi:hypothetical protein
VSKLVREREVWCVIRECGLLTLLSLEMGINDSIIPRALSPNKVDILRQATMASGGGRWTVRDERCETDYDQNNHVSTAINAVQSQKALDFVEEITPPSPSTPG